MTTDIDALVERLGEADWLGSRPGSTATAAWQAAQALTRLSEENARLREALEIISRSGFPAIGKIARAALQGDA